jgi:hypothetical protein
LTAVSSRAVPPYAVPTARFPFPRLATLAGAAPLGPDREALLATFVIARLSVRAADGHQLPATARDARSAAARSWLSSLSIPLRLKGLLVQMLTASAADDRPSLRTAVEELRTALRLDPTAVRELASVLASR